MEEDISLIMKGLTYRNSYQSVKALRSATGEAIHKLPASVHKMIESLKKQGVYKGGLS